MTGHLLTITRYDGAKWTFLYRSQLRPIVCCPSCDFVRPELVVHTLQEGVPGPFFHPDQTRHHVPIIGIPPDIGRIVRSSR